MKDAEGECGDQGRRCSSPQPCLSPEGPLYLFLKPGQLSPGLRLNTFQVMEEGADPCSLR